MYVCARVRRVCVFARAHSCDVFVMAKKAGGCWTRGPMKRLVACVQLTVVNSKLRHPLLCQHAKHDKILPQVRSKTFEKF